MQNSVKMASPGKRATRAAQHSHRTLKHGCKIINGYKPPTWAVHGNIHLDHGIQKIMKCIKSEVGSFVRSDARLATEKGGFCG
jgi:hypothetical protein